MVAKLTTFHGDILGERDGGSDVPGYTRTGGRGPRQTVGHN
ncbi:hypothetical protein Desgi_1170 [Desulfoscipio gibsoniae DSM 7213]|uniref:Uncharacterized protein n=1 Tax=Desulfoscipio gibsoniae DSM 7213 TaxID=767817 RepID=R4KBW6_9FIRM|nr:hypothetical protein Desgi_1170 [Desulfoscipio gibsoniae DSM 7213]